MLHLDLSIVLLVGLLNNIPDAITHSQLSLFAYFAWELHGQNSSFHKLLLVENSWYIIPIGIFFKSTAKFSQGTYSVGIRP